MTYQMTREMTCYDVIHEVDSAMHDVLPLDTTYFVLGGIASSALVHHDTRIDGMEDGSGFIFAPDEAADPTRRLDGTKRDIDILVPSALDDGLADKLKQTVVEAIDGHLLVSIFKFDKHEPPQNPAERLAATFTEWLSRRTIDENGILRYELFPLEQVVQPETYETWRLIISNGVQVNVLHPVGHMLAYRMRSISAGRTKDVTKLDIMTQNVLAIPEHGEALYDGAFKDWLDFAAMIQALNTGYAHMDELAGFDEKLWADYLAFRCKGNLLHFFESNKTIVKMAQQGPLQKALNLFVHAK